MPQVKRALRPLLDSGQMTPKEVGDICYLITSQVIIPMWVEKPCWTTASKIRRLLVQDMDMNKMKSLLRGIPFDEIEIRNQAAMAYDEFYRRVVGNYENEKARQNTDVYAMVKYSKSWQLAKGENNV